MKPISMHQLRCLGAIAALTASNVGKIRYFKRWDIGSLAHGDIRGAQIRAMIALWTRGLVEPKSEEAVRLYQDGECTCGCDQWAITDAGMEELKRANVKVPNIKPRPVRGGTAFDGFFGTEPDDPADFWKK